MNTSLLRPGSLKLPALLLVALVPASPIVAQTVGADSDLETSEIIELDPLAVRGRSGYGYNAARSATATRLPVPIAETPISIQVVTRQLLEDQAALGLEDAFRNVSGVVEAGNTLNAQSEVLPLIRAFESPVALRNGMRATTVGAVDLANVESVEVLKGPASILYGALQPGGVVNFTTKQPSSTAFTRLEQSIGSYSTFRTTIDSSGPLDGGETLLYRFNGGYTNSGSFRDEIELERTIVAPSFAWRAGENTEIGFDLAYTRETVAYDSGIPIDANGRPLVDQDTFFGDPDLDGRRLEDWFASYQLNHRISDNLTLRHRFQYHLSEPRNQSIRNRGVRGEPGALTMRQRYQDEERSDEEYQFVADVVADFRTGEAHHTALVGFDYVEQKTDFDRFRMNLPNVVISDTPAVDFTPPPDAERSPAFRDRTDWLALYAQDQITLLQEGRLNVLVGGRLDMVKERDQLDDLTAENDEFTGRLGLLYELSDHVSPYVSVTQSFLPNGPSTVDRNGALLAPETGLQYEAGLKLEFHEQRLVATLSAYEIEKEDVAVFDQEYFQDTGEFAWLAGVNQRSRGFEVDVSGQITESLSVVANYAHTDAEETANRTDPSRIGSPLTNVPDDTLRIWAAYNFESASPLRGLGVGVGARYEGARLVQFDADIELDSYTLFDAAVWYSRELESGNVYTVRLNLSNLTDEDYILRASDRSIAHPGAPFSATASFGIGF